MSKVGIIGGSGIYDMKGLVLKSRKTVKTPYGMPSAPYRLGSFRKKDVVFLTRHGEKHGMPPHMINYRANIMGLRKLGVTRILSISAVGGINRTMKPGMLVCLDQVLDMTKNRKSTFHDGREGVFHVDFTEPYCPQLRQLLVKAGKKAGISMSSSGTYVAVEGPRLESAAEIRSFRLLGGDVVGMTGMPEASLAREAEICYAGISVVANYAAGMRKRKLTVTEVMDAMKDATENIKSVLRAVLTAIPDEWDCACNHALDDAKI